MELWLARYSVAAEIPSRFDVNAVAGSTLTFACRAGPALMDAIYTPSREFAFDGKVELVPAFKLALAVD